eukprot:gene13781-18486_t
MGICGSKRRANPGEAAANDRSRRIDRAAQQDYKKETEIAKLLLLGAGESGKSTVLKQLRMLYGTEYSEIEKIAFKESIYHNIVDTVEALCLAAKQIRPDEDIYLTPQFMKICPQNTSPIYFREYPELDNQYFLAVDVLWKSEVFKSVWEKRHQSPYIVIESTAYFLDKLNEVTSPTYKPSAQDIIFLRVRTTGIREEKLQIDGR